MSLVAAQLIAKVGADTKEGEAGLDRVGRKFDETGQKADEAGQHTHGFAGHLAKIAGGLAVLDIAKEGFHLVAENVGEMVKAGMEANRTEGQTEAVLKSTGGAAGVTAEQVGALATSMMNQSGIQDDATRSAENMLLTFTNIHSNVFPATTKAVADMATAMNGGAVPSAEALRATAIQVGKALQDPVQGVTALQRVGVRLSETQKEQVKHFMAVGDAASAQKIILAELNTEFGGSAQAAGQANGGMAILSAQFDNMKQTVGQALIPILVNFLKAIEPLVQQFAQWLPGALKTTVAALQTAASMVGALTRFFQEHHAVLVAVAAAVGAVGVAIVASLVPAFIGWAVSAGAAAVATIAATWPVLAVAAAVGVLAAGIYELITHWKDIYGWFSRTDFGRQIIASFMVIKDIIMAVIGKIGDLLGVLGRVKDAIGGALGGLGKVAHGIGIPGFATGGVMPYSGLAVVGERGPEVVALPRGAQIYPSAARMQGSGPGGVTNNITIYPAQALFGPDELDAVLRRHVLLGSTSGAY